MKKWLRDQTVILTGASGGIGKQLCKILISKYGANVIGIGRNEQKMLDLSQELGENKSKFSYRLFDVASREQWQNFAGELTSAGVIPTLLINNAGVFPTFTKTTACPSHVIEQVLKTNYLSSVYAVENLLPIIKQAKKPSIYFVCSSSALCSVAGTAGYAASKSAMKAYAETLMIESKGDIYVGIAFPGTTKTDLFRNDSNAQNSALDKIACPSEKMAKRIARAIAGKKKRIVPGADAKLMNLTAKIAPVGGITLIKNVMKASHSKVFTNVFDYEQK